MESVKHSYTPYKVSIGCLLSLHSDIDFWNALQKRSHCNHCEDVLQDIYDGREYQRYSQFLSNNANVSLTLNTDGVAIFRSSKSSVWPVWLVINELPKGMR